MKYIMLTFLLACFSSLLHAHQTSDSFLSIKQINNQLSGEWRIPLDVLDTLQGKALGLDQNKNREITWGELLLKQTQITQGIFSSLKISQNGHICNTKQGSFQLDQLNTGLYLFFPFSVHCQAATEVGNTDDAIDNILVEYQLFFRQDPEHRGLLNFSKDKKNHTHVFSPTSSTFEYNNSKLTSAFIQFVKEGVWHIWIGLDHILFLLALLLPAVFSFDSGVRKVQNTFVYTPQYLSATRRRWLGWPKSNIRKKSSKWSNDILLFGRKTRRGG